MLDHGNHDHNSQHAVAAQLARPRPPKRKDFQAPHMASHGDYLLGTGLITAGEYMGKTTEMSAASLIKSVGDDSGLAWAGVCGCGAREDMDPFGLGMPPVAADSTPVSTAQFYGLLRAGIQEKKWAKPPNR